MERVADEQGRMNFHSFIMMCIPGKFTIDFSEIDPVPAYAKNLVKAEKEKEKRGVQKSTFPKDLVEELED